MMKSFDAKTAIIACLIDRALSMSLEAESLLGDACDFQSEIELVIAAFSAEYENDIPHLLKGLSKIFTEGGWL